MKLKRQMVPRVSVRFDVAKLKDPHIRAGYEVVIGGRFAALMDEEIGDVDVTWNNIMVYQGIKQITGKKAPKVSAIKDRAGKILTDPQDIKDRCKEHSDQLYNVNITADATILLELPTGANDEESNNTPDLLREEVEEAIRNMKAWKSPGCDNVTADKMQAAGKAGVDALFKLCEKVWRMERIPTDWSRAIIVPIFEKKDTTVFDNYRGISLMLCHAEKLFASIILQRIREKTDKILTESQAGFRRGRSTIDQLFSLRRLAEKYSE